MLAALAELVRLKDAREELDAWDDDGAYLFATDAEHARIKAMRDDYAANKPGAWDRARATLAAVRVVAAPTQEEE